MTTIRKAPWLPFFTACLLFLTVSCGEDEKGLPSCDGAEYEYEGAFGPESWDEICVDWTPCGGKSQSPINISGAVEDASLADIPLTYATIPTSIINKGHTIQVTVATIGTPCSIELNGETYELIQFHTHTHSEHEVNGQHSPMEIHFVHKNETTGKLVVIGVFVEEGTENTILKPVVDNLPNQVGATFFSEIDTYNPISLMPSDKSYFTYAGSLTTPPCSEIVTWIVMEHPIQASADQIHAFEALEHENARPVQALEGRTIKHHHG